MKSNGNTFLSLSSKVLSAFGSIASRLKNDSDFAKSSGFVGDCNSNINELSKLCRGGMKSIINSERGATFVEAAATLPLVLGFIFLLYDGLVIGYDWLSLHRVAQLTMREASVGVKKGETDPLAYLERAEEKGETEFKIAFGLGDGKTMSTGMAQICDQSGYDCTSKPITVTPWTSPADADNYIKVTVHKKLYLTPAGRLLAQMISSEHRELNLTVSAMGRVEKTTS